MVRKVLVLVAFGMGVLFGIPRMGHIAPNFTLPDIFEPSKTYSLSDFKGKVVLLNFWASWCTGCRAEMPEFIEVQKKYKDKGFVIVAVNVDRSPEKGINFLKELEEETGKKINFLVLYDGNKKVIRKYKPIGMPSSYLIGKDGRLIKYFPSSFTKENIDILIRAIEEALK